jgi:hypothetical protein
MPKISVMVNSSDRNSQEVRILAGNDLSCSQRTMSQRTLNERTGGEQCRELQPKISTAPTVCCRSSRSNQPIHLRFDKQSTSIEPKIISQRESKRKHLVSRYRGHHIHETPFATASRPNHRNTISPTYITHTRCIPWNKRVHKQKIRQIKSSRPFLARKHPGEGGLTVPLP